MTTTKPESSFPAEPVVEFDQPVEEVEPIVMDTPEQHQSEKRMMRQLIVIAVVLVVVVVVILAFSAGWL